MPLNLNLLLSAKLCKVVDSNYATVDEIAIEAGYDRGTIEGLLNGIPIGVTHQMRHRIGAALAPHFRAHPEMYRELDVFEPPPANRLFSRERISSRSRADQRKPRGVFEIESGSDEWRAFLIRDSHGRRRRIIYFPADEFTEADEEGMWRWLDRRDRLMEII